MIMNNTSEENTDTKKMDIPPIIPNRRKVKKVEDNFLKYFLICLCAVFLIALIVYRNEIINSFKPEVKPASKRWEISLPFSAKRQNILLMGVDVAENPDDPFKNARTDSIYLISIAPHAKNVNVISIPRDSKVYIHSHSTPDKINHAFAFGGIETTVKTVEQTLGVRIIPTLD